MHALFAKLALLLISPSLFMWGAAGYHIPTIVEFQHQADQVITAATPTFGNFNPTGGGTYRLLSSIGTTNALIYLSSFKEPVSLIPYTMTYLNSSIEFGTISPQSNTSEFISFTGITQNSDGSAILTGVSRGLSRTPAQNACVASSTLAQTHPGQSIFILSDAPCLFNEYYVLRNNATSTGVLTFTHTVPPRYDAVGLQAGGTYNATTSEFASVAYVNAIANAGVNNATESVKGIVELATQVEMSSSTNIGGTSASIVLQSQYATSSPFTPGRYVPITGVTGTLSAMFISTSSVYSWSALNTYTGGMMSLASTTIAANASNKLTLNALPYVFPPSRGASTTVFADDGTGNLYEIALPITVLYQNGNAFQSSTANSTTTLATASIPAGVLNATGKSLRITSQWTSNTANGNGCYGDIEFGTGAATTTIGIVGQASNAMTGHAMQLVSTVTVQSSTLQFATSFGSGAGNDFQSILFTSASSTVNLANKSYIGFAIKSTQAANCAFIGGTIELLTN